MEKAFNKFVLTFSFAFAIIALSILCFISFTRMRLTNEILIDLVRLILFSFPIIPVIWLFYLKNQIVRIVSLVLYGFLLLIFYSIFLFFAAFGAFESSYRPVFVKHISNEEKLVIYLSPDEGALGGNHPTPAIEQNVFPGIISRQWFSEKDLKYELELDSLIFEITGNRFSVPNYEILIKSKPLNLNE